MDRTRFPTDPFKVNLTGAVVLRGEALAIRKLIELVEQAAGRERVDVVFVKVSASKLWVKEGDPQ